MSVQSPHPAAAYLRGQLQQQMAQSINPQTQPAAPAAVACATTYTIVPSYCPPGPEANAPGLGCHNLAYSTTGCPSAFCNLAGSQPQAPAAAGFGCGNVTGSVACTFSGAQPQAPAAGGFGCQNYAYTGGCTFSGAQPQAPAAAGFGCGNVTGSAACTFSGAQPQAPAAGGFGCQNYMYTAGCTV